MVVEWENSDPDSEFGLDPDSIRFVDPYPDRESGSGSRRQCCGTVTIYYGSGSGSGSDF